MKKGILKEEKQKKNYVIYAIFVAILFFLLGSLCTYFVSNKILDKKEKPQTPKTVVKNCEDNKKEKDIDKDKSNVSSNNNSEYNDNHCFDAGDCYSKEIEKAFKSFSLLSFPCASGVTDKTDYLTINDISKQEILSSAIIWARDDNNKLSIKELNEYISKYVQDYRVNYQDVVDVLQSINKESFNRNFKNIDGDSFYYEQPIGCTFHAEDFINERVVKTELDGDNLIIYVKRAFARYNGKTNGDESESSNLLVDYYLDYNYTILKESDMSYSESMKSDTPNWELYNTYKYTFKVADGNYYFQSFELVK